MNPLKDNRMKKGKMFADPDQMTEGFWTKSKLRGQAIGEWQG